MFRSFSSVSAAALLCAASLAGTAHAAPSEGTPDSNNHVRVIGGSKLTDDAQNPGAVLTTVQGKQHCTGIRIGPTWVITARHCYNHPFENHTFDIDGVYTESIHAKKGQMATVKKVHVAPDADTVLIELNEATRGPVASWTGDALRSRDNVDFYGWGYTRTFGHRLSDVLKKGSATTNSRTSGNYYGGVNYTMRGKNSCIAGGDSGGPFFRNGQAIANASWSFAGSSAQYCILGVVPFDQNAEWITRTTGIAPNGSSYVHPGR